MKSVLFLGGSRFFGRYILGELLRQEWSVVVVSRGMREIPYKHPNLEIVQCDRCEENTLAGLIGGREFDTVVDNICYQPDDARAAVRIFSGYCQKLIFTSTVMAYLNAYKTIASLSESDWFYSESSIGMEEDYGQGEIQYALAKRECERVYEDTDNFKTVVFRLHNVVGEDDFSGKSGEFIRALIQQRVVRVVGSKNDTYQQVYSKDLGRLFCEAIDRPNDKVRGKYNVAINPIRMSNYLAFLTSSLSVSSNIEFIGDTASNDGLNPFPRNVVMDCRRLQGDFETQMTSYDHFLAGMGSWYEKEFNYSDSQTP